MQLKKTTYLPLHCCSTKGQLHQQKISLDSSGEPIEQELMSERNDNKGEQILDDDLQLFTIRTRSGAL